MSLNKALEELYQSQKDFNNYHSNQMLSQLAYQQRYVANTQMFPEMLGQDAPSKKIGVKTALEELRSSVEDWLKDVHLPGS